MHLVEPISIAPAALPVAELRAHLRMGTGFGQDTLQDSVLVAALRAAISLIERQTAKSLVERSFHLKIQRWSGPNSQLLPRGPVSEISEIAIRHPGGDRQVFDPARYRLETDGSAATLRSTNSFPRISAGSVAEIAFRAGFGPDWERVPADLALATITLAAARYEDRIGENTIPKVVLELIAPYRPLKMLRPV